LESQPHQKEVAKYINTASSAQIQHLLFGEYVNKVRSENETRVFKVEKSDEEIEEERKRLLALNPYAELTSSGKLTPHSKRINLYIPVKFDGHKRFCVISYN
jgi:hypothetical protein